jgi:hypothetical protein
MKEVPRSFTRCHLRRSRGRDRRLLCPGSQARAFSWPSQRAFLSPRSFILQMALRVGLWSETPADVFWLTGLGTRVLISSSWLEPMSFSATQYAVEQRWVPLPCFALEQTTARSAHWAVEHFPAEMPHRGLESMPFRMPRYAVEQRSTPLLQNAVEQRRAHMPQCTPATWVVQMTLYAL